MIKDLLKGIVVPIFPHIMYTLLCTKFWGGKNKELPVSEDSECVLRSCEELGTNTKQLDPN